MVDTRFMNWVDFDALRKETDLVLMPFGAVEVYGPHLPMGADGISTMALAERVASEEKAFVAPLIPIGYSKALMDFPGTLNVRPSSLVEYARDLAESYIGWGCKRILFINGHAGNVAYLSELATQLEEQHGVRVAQIDWWRFIQPLVEDMVEADFLPHGHASEFGTSVMLHLAGEHVKMDRAVRTEPKSANAFPDFIRPRKYGDATDTGVVGDGTLGTEEKGAETVRRAVARTLEFIRSDEFTSPS
ncbi:MAG: creatininase family protein [Thermomicrobiales bacterium]